MKCSIWRFDDKIEVERIPEEKYKIIKNEYEKRRKMKIIGLNTQFDNIKNEDYCEYHFASSASLLDYDAVVIDTDFIANNSYETEKYTYENKSVLLSYDSKQIVEDCAVIKDQIVELLRQGRNVFLLMGFNDNCYVYTGQKEYSGSGKNARQTNIIREFDTYSFLPIHLKATYICGNKVDICCNSPYREFIKQTVLLSEYKAYFTCNEPCEIVAKIKKTDKIIAAIIPYEKGNIVCLPHPYYEEDYSKHDDWENNGKKYLDCLVELIKKLDASEDDYIFPQWSTEISILGEKNEIAQMKKIEKKISDLKTQLDTQERKIQDIQKYKLLLTSSGQMLEEITKDVLSNLGLTILETEKGRSDLIAEYGDCAIVAEIKGVSKTAAEKHAAQLEKWVSMYIDEHDRIPKALLIVNGYCNTPLCERTEDVFPQQMLDYCIARKHVLITTTQLLCMYIDLQKHPENRNEVISGLLTSTGKYDRYLDYESYFD